MITRKVIRIAAAALVAAVAMSGVAIAHANHKIMGTVTMVAADHVMVKDRAGKEHTIKLVKTTKVTRNKKAMKASDLAVGTRVVATVVSDKDMTGKLIEAAAAPASTR